MKIVKVVLLGLMLMASVANAGVKAIDSDDAVPSTNSRVAWNGSLDANSDTYNRIWGGLLSLECSSDVDDWYFETALELFCFQVSDNEPIEIIMGSESTVSDSFFTLYCDPFDAMNPELNVVFTDDDDGAGYLSAFQISDGITLTVGNTYYLVVSNYMDEYGDFSISTSANISECGTVSTENTTWDSLKASYR